MRIAKQNEIDAFLHKAVQDADLYPYLSVVQYIADRTETKSDWNEVIMINDEGTCMMVVRIERAEENTLAVSIWSKNAHAAGRCAGVVEDMAKRYNSRAITSVVHASNKKSISYNKRLLGKPWGKEPGGAWNSNTGQWEDLLHFRRNLR